MQRLVVLIFLSAITMARPALAAAVDDAKGLFDRYVHLEHAFDPAAADLYADDALIKNKRTYPWGEVRELTLPATQYKALIRQAMPLAKARNDTNSYSDITFTPEGSGVRIRAMRFSNLKKYTSPLSLLVSPDSKGRWLIKEELSESRP